MQRGAHGVLTLLSSLDLNALTDLPDAQSVETEQSALDNGLTQLIKHIELRAPDSDSTASAILEAHRSLATDTSLRQHLLSGVSRSKLRPGHHRHGEPFLRHVLPFQQHLFAGAGARRARHLLPAFTTYLW